MNFIRFVEIISIIVVVVGSTAVSIGGFIWKLSVESYLSAILGLLAAFSLYQVAANVSIERSARASQEPLSKEVTQAEWYDELMPVVSSAKKEIQITHHEPRIPTITGVKSHRRLWGILEERMDDSDILFRWIVGIDNLEKLNWVSSLIEKNKSNDNLNIHYSEVDLQYPAPPQSLQIIDRNILFIIDMSKGHYSVSEMGIGLISRDTEIVKQFQGYYDQYWYRTTALKEGPKIYRDRIEDLRKKLEK